MKPRLSRWKRANAITLARKVARTPLLVFDVDGTLTASRKPISRPVARLLCALLSQGKWIAIVGGGSLKHIQRQVVRLLPCNGHARLVLCPLSGAELYMFQGKRPRAIYRHTLAQREVRAIRAALQKATEICGYSPQRVWGSLIDNRGSQVTFSALGQDAPLAAKRRWHERGDIRPCLTQALRRLLPQYEVRMGGITSIDITLRGIDKAYALRRLAECTGVPENEIVYVGDALYPQGNDAPVLRTRATSIWVSSPRETQALLQSAHNLLETSSPKKERISQPK